MAIRGIFCDSGIAAAITAQNGQGFEIYADSFGVSNTASVLEPSMVPNSGLFYEAPVSSRVQVDGRTVKVICTVPQNAVSTVENILEVYIYGRDQTTNELYLLAAGQPDIAIQYDPSGSTTLELQLSLVDVNLTAQMVFTNTIATELSEHETDPNAHVEIIDAIAKAGILIPAGRFPFAYQGQSFDEYPSFDGTPATTTYEGVTFTGSRNGTELNGLHIVFDGITTLINTVAAFNAANPTCPPLDYSGAADSAVLVAGSTPVFASGTYAVSHLDLVYQDVDGLYKQALADGTIKSKVAGVAYVTRVSGQQQLVRSSGFFSITTGFPVGSNLFLSSTAAGKLTDISTQIQVGVQTSTAYVLLGVGGGSGSSLLSQGFDAVVTDALGFESYPTTQEAIDAVSAGGSILVDKIDILQATLDMGGKNLSFVFNGPNTGWSRYLGTNLEFNLTFSTVPTSGTWRIEWDSQTSIDMPYNANAAAVQAAFNAFTGQTGVTVTGNYSSGFHVVFADIRYLPLPTFLDPGQNAIQQFNFSDTPDDGTVRFSFLGNQSGNWAWDNSTLALENFLQAVPGIASVSVTGSFAQDFVAIEFNNASGLQPVSDLTVVANILTKNHSPISVNGSVSGFPISPVEVQAGRYPASNLYASGTHISITVVPVQAGTPIGTDTAIVVGGPNCGFTGKGLITNFPYGIDLNGEESTTVDLIFVGCTEPVEAGTLLEGIDYCSRQSLGIDRERIRTVGTQAQYPDLVTALSFASDGDRIVVLENQTVNAPLVVTKKVTLDFKRDARIVTGSLFSGSVVSMADYVRSINMHIVLTVDGTFDAAVTFHGLSGHHENLKVELGGFGINVSSAFVLASDSNSIFLDGLIKRNSGTSTQVLYNISPMFNHNVLIRDVDTGFTYDAKPLDGEGYNIVAGEDLSRGQLVYVSPGASDAGRTSGAAYLLDVSAANQAVRGTYAGVVIAPTPAGQTALVMYSGFFNWMGLVAASVYYADPLTLGGFTNVQPVVSGQKIVPVAFGFTPTLMLFTGVAAGVQRSFPVITTDPVSYGDEVTVSFPLLSAPQSASAVRVFINGVRQSTSSWSLVSQAVVFNTAPDMGVSIEFEYVLAGQSYISLGQEVPQNPSGDLINFTIMGQPFNKAGMNVWVDGLKLPSTSWTLVQGPICGIILNTAIGITQDILTDYFSPVGGVSGSGTVVGAANLGAGAVGLYSTDSAGVLQFKSIKGIDGFTVTDNGDGTVSIGGASTSGPAPYYPAISNTDMTNGYITLPYTPVDPTRVVFDLPTGAPQVYGVDYIVTGARLGWTGLGLDGEIGSGMTGRVLYT